MRKPRAWVTSASLFLGICSGWHALWGHARSLPSYILFYIVSVSWGKDTYFSSSMGGMI